MKVLLGGVGRRDPVAVDGTDGALLQGVSHIGPSVVYLFPTAGGSNSTAVNGTRTVEAIATRWGAAVRVHLRPLALPDPTDYGAVVAAFRDGVRAARAAEGAGAEWHVMLSSGAPQFRLAWSLLVLNGELPARCWEARDPNYPGASVWEAAVRVLAEPAVRDRFRDAVRRCDFAAAGEAARLWSRQAPEPAGQTRAAWVARLMGAYQKWDAVDWVGARDLVRAQRRAAVGRAAGGELRAALEAQETALEQILTLKPPQGRWLEGAANLIDLYHNARRRERAGLYVDALARVRRIVEGTIYAVVRAHGGTDLGRGTWALGAEIDHRLAALIGSGEQIERTAEGHMRLDVPPGLTIVRTLRPLHKETTDRLVGLMDHRNKSIAAHGMDPVTRQVVQRALDEVRELLTAALAESPESYPFSVAALDALAQPLTDALL